MWLDPDILALEKQVEEEPTDFELRLQLATLYHERGHYERAVEECALLAMDFPPTPLAVSELSVDILLRKRLNAEALQVLINITCRDSEYKPSKIRFNLALCLARLGEFQEAKGPLEKLLRDDPDYPQAKAMLEGLDLALNKGYRISEAKEARRRSLVPRPSLLQRFLQFFRR